MRILVEINGTQQEKLAEVAHRLNVRPEELATAAVEDFLARTEADFQAAANRVLEKTENYTDA